ncbi:ribonuclease 3-like [Lytechinus variegatus]|uniref:ribonuclease 3-like n=1 Tax=Lytechinus variegatus TaxID=7654 RepID=UPI001BB16ECF|nr:ribonuclease 3-like [Lytechinus variegatus]XP_041482094.1 ribonuclease 3-like [Lytechinus variegatus]XP_041482095.1 ribonuclease 3-like [Lytechinus variegatus]
MHSRHPPPGPGPERPPFNPRLSGPYSRPPPPRGPGTGPIRFGQNHAPLGPPPGSQGPFGPQGQYPAHPPEVHPNGHGDWPPPVGRNMAFPNRPPPPLPPFMGPPPPFSRPPPPLPFPNGPPPRPDMRIPPPGFDFRMRPPPPFNPQRPPPAPHLPPPPPDFSNHPDKQGMQMSGFDHKGGGNKPREQCVPGGQHQDHKFRPPGNVSSPGDRFSKQHGQTSQDSSYNPHREAQRPQNSSRQEGPKNKDLDGLGSRLSRQSDQQDQTRDGGYHGSSKDSIEGDRQRSADDRYRDRERSRDRSARDSRDLDSRDYIRRQRDRSRERSSRRERSRSPRQGRHGDRGRTREKSPSRDRSSRRELQSEDSRSNERSRSPRRYDRSSRETSSQRNSSPHSRTSVDSRDQKDRRSRSPSRDQRSKDRESSLHRKNSRKTDGPATDPSKPCQRWNDLERELREEERQEKEKEVERDPFEDSDPEDWGADDTPWIQCSPRENFYSINPNDQINASSIAGTEKMKELLKRFEAELVERGPRVRASQPEPEQKKPELHWHYHSHDDHGHSDSSDSDSDSDASSGEEDENYDFRIACLENRANHPWRLAENLWFNDPGEMYDGPLCKCSIKQKKSGIRHNIFPGEKPIPLCEPHTNNASRLHHYRVTISPTTNFLTTTQTVIIYDKREYIFEGFSLFSHHSLEEVPECKVVRFGREYTLHFFPEPMPEHFTVKGLDLFSRFLFEEILELWDFDFKGKEGGCHHFHFMPRFARLLPNNGKEILSMHHVIQYLIRSSRPIIDPAKLDDWLAVSETSWQRYVDKLQHMIATRPGKKPSSIRIDQLDRDQMDPEKKTFPVIVHFGVRPAQLSYIGDPNYRKLLKSFTRLRHLLLNKPRVTEADKEKMAEKEAKLQKIRIQGSRVREVTAEVSSEHMLATGIGVDICQHALMLPVLVNHLRYFGCLNNLYKVLGYKFQDPMLLRYAMTHPSYKLYFGTTPDHVRNSLYNCGIRCRQDHTEHKKVLAKERKKGINQLYRIMSLMASNDELPSHIKHYERLEFLGDAVIEFLSSTHLYHLFPDLEEGGLATYRMALVQNQHLSVLAKKLELDKYMLYAHGPDLCRPYDLRHAMANCLEAVFGAIYLEAGLELCREIFGKLLFEEEHFQNIWLKHPKDPLQADFPDTDRHLIKNSEVLQKLTVFEEDTGMRFRHIRLLARAFTQRSVGYTNLTQGSNQRLEFLGDSVLQLVVSSYLYKHFPYHHEGHLSLLRSSLVNNKTQSIIAQELGLVEYIIEPKIRPRNENNVPMKILADLVEALIGAMYVDHGLDVVETFCGVVFYPRLKDFIQKNHWNDAKSQLQQCCLTLRVEGQEPDVPYYKVISQSGPTNSRQYSVAVYFKAKRMSTGTASNIRDAEMEAAKNALRKGNFPHLYFQRKCAMLRKQREAMMDDERMKEEEERRRNGEGKGDSGARRGRSDDSRGRRDEGRVDFSRSEGRRDERRREDGRREDRDERRRDEGRRDGGRRDEGRRDDGRRDDGRREDGRRDDGSREDGRRDDRRKDEGRRDEREESRDDRRRDDGRRDERRREERRDDRRKEEGRRDEGRGERRREENQTVERKDRRDERANDRRSDDRRDTRRDDVRRDERKRNDGRRRDDKSDGEGRPAEKKDDAPSSTDVNSREERNRNIHGKNKPVTER